MVRERFGTLHAQAVRSDLDGWADTLLGRLALEGIATGEDEALSLDKRQFYYMPLMHAEDPVLQEISIERFTALRDVAKNTLSFARQHGEDIRRFGRFPYRNEALGHLSTPEEDEHMRPSPG